MKILYVEDEFAHVVLAQRTLEDNLRHEFSLIHAETMKAALQILSAQSDIDLVLSDLRLPDGTGLELLQKIREVKSPPAVVLVTGQGDQEVAVAALKSGAADYLVKQSDYLHRLPVVISNAIAQNRLLREQEALRQAEVKYQALVEQIPAVVFLDKVDDRQTCIYVSPRIQELTGYTAEEWYAHSDIWQRLIHPEDRERILLEDRKSTESGLRFLQEYRIIKRDGSILWVKEDTNLICDKQGTPLYWQGILLDITKEKESLETIRKSEDRFRRIFHASPIATCVTRLEDGKFIDANQSYLHLIGKSLETLLNQNSIEMGLWKNEEDQKELLTQLQKSGTVRGVEHQFTNTPTGPKDTIAYYELIELGGQICILAMFYDVTEQKQAQKDLQTERDFALQVLNNMGQGLTVTRKDGRFEYVNPAYAGMLGYLPDDMVGKTPSDFTVATSLQRLQQEKELRKKGVTTTYESTLSHKDSHEVPALITGVPRKENGVVTGTIAVITDLTDRKKTEEALARQVKELTILHSVAVAEAECQSEDEIIERVTQITSQLYPELCGILLLNETSDHLTPHSSYIGAQSPNWRESYPITDGITGKAVSLDKIIRVADVSQEGAYIEIAAGVRSELSLPIRVSGRVIGALNVESKKLAAFTENDERFLNTVANSVGTSLERLRFLKEEQKHLREAELLRESTAILAASLEPNELFSTILSAISELIPNDRSSVFIESSSNEMMIAATRGSSEPERFIGQKIAKSKKWKMLCETRQAQIIGDIKNNPLLENWDDMEYMRSWMGIPLASQDKVFGYINLGSQKLNAFTKRDTTIGQTFANSAAIALGNARLYQEALRASERRAVLHRISQDIVRFGQDFEQIYAAIHEAAAQLMACDVFCISLKDEAAKQNIGVYIVECGVRYKPEINPIHVGITGAVVNGGKSIILEDEADIEKRELVHFGSDRHVHSVVAVPMRISDKIIGMISAQSYDSHAYGAEEQSLLEMLATHAATAIENGRLFESEQKRRQEAENLRQAAAAISSTLDPDRVMTDILNALKQVIYYDSASVFLHEGEWLRLAIYKGFTNAELIGLKFPASDELFQEIKRLKRPLIIEDAQKDSRFNNWGASYQVHGWMSVPLIARGNVMGYITLDNFQVGAYSEAISATAMAFANQGAAALENARLFQEQIQRSKIIEALAEIANEIATTRDVQPVLDQITRRALDMLNANHVAIYLLQEDQVTLRTMAAYGIYQRELLGHTIRVGEGITGNIFLKAKAEIIKDTRQDPRRVTVPGTPEKEEKLESLMSSPLVLRGKTIGVINAWRLKENGLFNESELNFLVGIAHQVSVCIESGWLFQESERLLQETRRQAKEAAAIAKVGRDISATLKLDIVLESIATYAMDLLHGETSAVYLAQGNQLRAIAAIGADAEAIKNDLLMIGRGILGSIALQNIGEFVNAPYDDPRMVLVKGTDVTPFEHLMGVPIMLKDKHTGLLAVWRSGEDTDFKDHELEFLTSLAQQAAVAIENARLYDEKEHQVKELETANRRLSTLRDIDAAIASSLELRLTLKILIDQTINHLNVDAVSIAQYKPEYQNLTQIASTGFHIPSPTHPLMRLGEGLSGRVIAERTSLYITDLQNAPEAKNERLILREGFVTYIGIPLIIKGQLKGVFEVFHRSPLYPDEGSIQFLQTLAGQAAIAIDNSQLVEDLQRSNQDLMMAYDKTLEGWAGALEIRDSETEGHTRRVAELTLQLGRFMGIKESDLVNMHRGALLHDIGKMGVPDHILKKTGKLDSSEWVEMKKHPDYAYNLLKPIAYLRGALDIPYCHHEHWDGSGYPQGLKGEQIPLSARVFSVVDIWDALLSNRPYRDAWPREKVAQYLKDVAGTVLDPTIVDIFFKMMDNEKNQLG